MSYNPTKETASTFKVHVKQHHIDGAIRSAGGNCMISEAIKAMPDVQRVQTDIQTIRFTHKGKRCVYLTPRRAQIMILKYDRGDKLAPWSFTLSRGQITARSASDKANRARLEVNDGVVKRTGGRAPPRAHLGARRVYGLMNIEKACLHPSLGDK